MSVTALKLKQAPLATEESLADKVRRLRDEAQGLARDHAQDFVHAIADLESFAGDIADGGEAYPVGIRQMAKKLLGELQGARLNVTSVLGRD
ncbi:MAG: hypothetical protein ACREEW_07205 [Caulobacteraceae bacterium]